MAEVVGVIASAISIAGFAQQLAKSVVAIKRTLANVKHAPDELRETLEELASISDIMIGIRDEESINFVDGAPSTTLKQSLSLCQRATRRVCDLAEELEKGLGRRRTKIKIVLKQETFGKMLNRLDRSKADLSLAYLLYSNACTAREHELISNRMIDIQADQAQAIPINQPPGPPAPRNDSKTKPTARRQVYQPQRESRARYRIRLPPWMSQYPWEIAFHTACGSWTTSLRTFRVLKYNSDVIQMCMRGDLETLKLRLQERQLSLNDEDDLVSNTQPRNHRRWLTSVLEINRVFFALGR